MYTGGACLAAGIRGKEDPFNYGIGGILVGGLYGLKAKRLQSGFYAAFVLGAAGVFCAISEDVVVKNWALDAEERKRSNGPYLQEKRL